MVTIKKPVVKSQKPKSAASLGKGRWEFKIRYTGSIDTKRLHHIGIILLIVAILIATAGLVSRAWYEVSSGVLHGDAQIFQTVGRGMLNGLKPYVDLFETKPPGVFLLHALSLKLFGNQFLVKLLQALVLLGIPFLVAIPSIAIAQDRSASQRKIISLLSILFGLLLALFTANQAGLGLTESYGAFFAIAFLVIALQSHPGGGALIGWKKIGVLGVLMLLAIGFKEPFLLIILAGVILLQKDLLSSFIYPFCIAVLLGFVALLVLGLASPFFQIYLPHMMGYHILQHKGSLFVYALEIWRTFINMGAYSWWFALGALMLWIGSGYQSIINSRWSFARWFVASYLMFIAIAIGGDFYGHHFVFAVPVYVVFWWMILRNSPDKIHPGIISGFAITLIAAAFVNTQLFFGSQIQGWKAQEAETIRIAGVVDTVMERCGWENYLQMIPRGGGPYAYTKTSPYGPIFVHYSRFIGANTMYQSAYISALKEAKIAIVIDLEDSDFTEYTLQYIQSNFSEVAPACAGEDFVQPAPFHLLFRQS